MDSKGDNLSYWPKWVPVRPLFVILAAGSFHGKSLIASYLASRLGIPHILNTDMIRNILRAQYKRVPAWLGSSTYLLASKELARQITAVSDLLSKTMETYRARGESLIVEGMHLSRTFLTAESERGDAILVGLNNITAFEKRIEHKTAMTRLCGYKSRYSKYRAQVQTIHCRLLQDVRGVGGQVISFRHPRMAAARIAGLLLARRSFRSLSCPGEV